MGRFGVGFWSVLRIKPSQVSISSWPAHGEPWHLDLALDDARATRRAPEPVSPGLSGTRIGVQVAFSPAAACDALVRDAFNNPAAPVAFTNAQLASTAVDLGIPGPDNVTGAGRLDCLAAAGAPTAICQNVDVTTDPGVCETCLQENCETELDACAATDDTFDGEGFEGENGLADCVDEYNAWLGCVEDYWNDDGLYYCYCYSDYWRWCCCYYYYPNYANAYTNCCFSCYCYCPNSDNDHGYDSNDNYNYHCNRSYSISYNCNCNCTRNYG